MPTTDAQALNPLFVGGIFLIKVGMIGVIGMAFLFSLVVIRQVQLMTDTLITEVSPLLRILSFIHAGVVLIALILAIALF